ncbi:MAG: ATP-binding cassette domain-containing protein [Chloroflexi bacterium]|nr:ATP-binding cassette domain-containing protein [Chloroflexota bacterium]MYF64432.1 ATP-binding cassette domain-containing protein [Chloroflexota bacterium]MYK35892.1 ATP-binding cassette domain-containing protein [Chloroflexota bacterium]
MLRANSALSSSNAPAVLLDGVSKRYDEATVLAPLSLAVEPGERVALIGPSGAGKTTLLRLIAGAVAPSTGCVELRGRNVASLRPGRELARLVGMIAQQFDLVPNLSVLHNVLAGRLGEWSFGRSLLSLVWPRDQRLAFEALERVGVTHLAHQRAARLSGGEQQRVAIARVLVQRPTVVLADEPVASLDRARAREVVRLLTDVTEEQGETLVASIHSIDLAREFFDRIVGLRNGLVQFDVPAFSIRDRMLEDLYEIEGLRSEV